MPLGFDSHANVGGSSRCVFLNQLLFAFRRDELVQVVFWGGCYCFNSFRLCHSHGIGRLDYLAFVPIARKQGWAVLGKSFNSAGNFGGIFICSQCGGTSVLLIHFEPFLSQYEQCIMGGINLLFAGQLMLCRVNFPARTQAAFAKSLSHARFHRARLESR